MNYILPGIGFAFLGVLLYIFGFGVVYSIKEQIRRKNKDVYKISMPKFNINIPCPPPPQNSQEQ